MPDTPARDEVVALRAANARRREVIGARDTEIGMLREQVEALAAQVAELRARLSQNSRNSSKPPSAGGAGQAGAEVAAQEDRPRAGPPEGAARCDAGDDR